MYSLPDRILRKGADTMPAESIIIEIPRKLVHSKEEDLRTSQTGAKFAWIDISTALGLEGYGFFFPEWLITEKLEKCKLELQTQRPFKGSYIENIFTIEKKTKEKGKRFKQYKYTAPQLAELLQRGYAENLQKIEEAEKDNIAFAYVVEAVNKYESVGFYCIGYIRGKMFYSDKIERFRGGDEAKGGKQIGAKSCKIIAEHLTQTDIADLLKAVKALDIARSEKEALEKKRDLLPYPYKSDMTGWLTSPENEYIIHAYRNGSTPRFDKDHYTIPGYIEKLEAIESAYKDALAFLEQEEKALIDMLESWGSDNTQTERK